MPARVNRVGGAIALGHPGRRRPADDLLATCWRRWRRLAAAIGLQTMCESGGMANATLIERL